MSNHDSLPLSEDRVRFPDLTHIDPAWYQF